MTEPKRPRRCPICGKGPLAPDQRFCSRRCETIDLGRWLSGCYGIPAEEDLPEDPDAGGQP